MWPDTSKGLHGTAVASLISQMMPDAKIAPLRHNYSEAHIEGKGLDPVLKDCTECFKVIAVHYAAQCTNPNADLHPLAVVNCSFLIEEAISQDVFFPNEDIREFEKAYQKLLELGVVVVTAAGNNSRKVGITP